MTRVWTKLWPLILAMAILALFAWPATAGADGGEISTIPIPRDKPVLLDNANPDDGEISTIPIPRDNPVLRDFATPKDKIVVYPPETYTPPPPVTAAQHSAPSGYYAGYHDPAHLTREQERQILIDYLDEKGMRSSTHWNSVWNDNLTVLRAAALSGYAPVYNNKPVGEIESSNTYYYIYWTGEWTTVALDPEKKLVRDGEDAGGPKIAPVNHADYSPPPVDSNQPPDPNDPNNYVTWSAENTYLWQGNDPCGGQPKPQNIFNLVCDTRTNEWKYARR